MSNGCRPLSNEDLSSLLSFVHNVRDRALIILGVRSGYRISELLSIRVCDITQHGAISNRVTVYKRNTKGKIASRSVPLHDEAAEAVKTLIDSSSLKQEDYLFQSREGVNKAITACQAWRIITRAADKAKLSGKVGSHSLRKSFAQKVYVATGKDLVATQRALGHSNINSTTHYLEIFQNDIDNAIRST